MKLYQSLWKLHGKLDPFLPPSGNRMQDLLSTQQVVQVMKSYKLLEAIKQSFKK